MMAKGRGAIAAALAWLALAAVLPAKARAEEPERRIVQTDNDTIGLVTGPTSRDGDNARATVEIIYRQPNKVSGVSYVFITMTVDVDCAGRRARIGHIIARDTALKVVAEGESGADWQAIVADSNMDHVRMLACEGQIPAGSTVTREPLTTLRGYMLGDKTD